MGGGILYKKNFLLSPNKNRIYFPIFQHELRHGPLGLIGRVLTLVRLVPDHVFEPVVPVHLYNTTVNRILVVPGLLTPPGLWEIVGADVYGSNLLYNISKKDE